MIRLLNELDAARITRLASMGFPPELDEAIDHADLCSPVEVPADLVTMNSCLEMQDLKTGVLHRLVLCYPKDANPSNARISVLSPVGASLLGRRLGDVALWTNPGGEQCAAKIVRILFQPEAVGDYAT